MSQKVTSLNLPLFNLRQKRLAAILNFGSCSSASLSLALRFLLVRNYSLLRDFSLVLGLALILCLSLAFGFAGPASAKPSGKASAAQMKPVMQLMSQKQFAKAAQQLETLDRTGHCSDSIHYFLGVCYQNLNQLEQAKANYSRASSSTDPSVNYWAQVGYSQVERYQATRSHEGAANNFDRVGNTSGALIGSGGGGGSRSGGGRSGFS